MLLFLMKSRVPLAGYILVLLLYFFFLPGFSSTFANPNLAIFASMTFISKVLLDAGLSIFLLISLAFSRMFFIGSDLENLLITGVSKWKLTSGIFLFLVVLATPLVLLGDRVIILFPLSYNVPGVFLGYGTLLLYFMFIFMAMLSLVLGFDRSLYVIIVVSLLNFSNLIGNPFSMGNLDSSMYLWGSAAFAAVLASVLALLVVSISREGYAPYRIARKRRREFVKTPFDFSGMKPHKASFTLGFSLTFSSLVNNNSPRGPRYSRFRTSKELAYLIIFNVGLSALLVYLYHTAIGHSDGSLGDTLIIYSSVFVEMIIWSMVSISFSHERIWLLGSTIGGRSFIKNYVLSKSALLSALMLPSLIPLLAMAIIGHPLFLRLGVLIAVTLVVLSYPAAVLGLYISGYLLPEQYVRNEMPVSGTLSFFIISVPLLFALVAGVVSYFYVWFLPSSAAAMGVVAAILVLNNRFNDRTFRSLVLRRFL